MATPAYIGIDIETTGLDTSPISDGGDRILEIAVILVADDLSIIDHTSSLVDFTRDEATVEISDAVARCGQFVRTMHFDNGLFADLNRAIEEDSLPDAERVERHILDMLDRHGITAENPLPLLGNSPRSIDGPMVTRDMPALAARINHHTVDATSLAEILTRTFHAGDASREAIDDARAAAAEMLRNMGGESATTHRALFDIICSVEQIRRALPRLAARVAAAADTAV